MSILIVDDSPNSSMLLQIILDGGGYSDILIAGSAKDAFEMLGISKDGNQYIGMENKNSIDLILMDIFMPELDGIQATQFIKKYPELQDIPIVMVSATGDMERLSLAFQAGAVDYIRKPVEETELIARVCAVLKLRHEMNSRKAREKELKALTTKLEEALDAAEAANKAKSQFLANMSHEIRTPMNAIIGMTNLALSMELTPKLRNYLTTVQNSSRSLLGLINDILDFSKIEAGKLTMERTEFELPDVFDRLSDMFGEKAGEKNIEIVLSLDKNIPLNLIGDPLRLNQILVNLTSNAIKFTEKGDVIISCDCIEKTDTEAFLQFSVKDSGIGISEEQSRNLFSAFTQADSSTTRKYGGTGLGLAISKRLTEMMGGQIWLESALGKGSIFRFTAHFGLQKNKKTVPRIVPKEIQDLNILVVDDNETARVVIQETFNSLKLKSVGVDSGEKAIEIVKNNPKPFDLIVMDWRLPGIDGIRTSELIKNDPKLANIHIIMLTAFGKEKEMTVAKDIGIEHFLFKPVKSSVLFDTIVEIFCSSGNTYTQVHSHSLVLSDYNFSGLKVLLVEDNDINQAVATDLLGNAQISVEIANNGKEAVTMVLKAYETNKLYNAVLMDVQMPEMDGMEATACIRKYELSLKNNSRIPIIAMTAHAMSGDREKCINAGMDDYVTKPIEPDELFSALAKWGNIKLVKPNIQKQNHEELEAEIDEYGGFNIEIALKRLGGNRNLLLQLIQKFIAGYAQSVDEIEKNIESNKMEMALRILHTLKGLAGNFGAIDLQEASRNLEMVMQNELSGSVYDYFPPLRKKLKRVLATMTKVLEHAGMINSDKNKDTTQNKDSDQNKDSKIVDKNQNLQSPLNIKDTKNEKPADTLPEKIPGIDISSALKRVSGNKDLFKRLICKFVNEYQNVVGDIKNASTQNDLKTAQRVAHTLKGLAGNFCATHLYDLSREVEFAFKDNNMDGLDTKMETLSKELQLVFSSIDQLYPENKAERESKKIAKNTENVKAQEEKNPNITNDSHIKELSSIVTKMISLLDDYDSEAKDHIEPIKNLLKQAGIYDRCASIIEKMCSEIDKYDFDSAKDALTLLAKELNITV